MKTFARAFCRAVCGEEPKAYVPLVSQSSCLSSQVFSYLQMGSGSLPPVGCAYDLGISGLNLQARKPREEKLMQLSI